jgi:hypothetical protein
MAQQPSCRPPVLDHLGLVAGMDAARGLGDVIDRTTPQTPEMRVVTAGYAVKARVRNGLGLVPHTLDRMPQFCPPKPTSRLLAPGLAPRASQR